MAEELKVISGTKEERYMGLIPQVTALLHDEKDLIANMANICAALRYSMNFFWVGFYIVKNNELVLGPFQGPVACTRIQKGKGVCGAAWSRAETVIVPDVEEFPGHISCNSASKSEIVVPVFDKNNLVKAVLDVDSETLNSFDETDKKFLEQIVSLLDLN